ncbi:hypothetical protein ASPZODRAFT_130515 [Penicilliopsis zonata CBS 506.65]|uniref:Spindle pole body associated protein SnaD n=1 Tax=Penicilliopsis zonata CBS 506.65 TaxID=1073090 RepID=A0A1L9SMM2_9EURO|nr:hypothetical protein ASPZODRAFT_130515 [Penicilliopsis zonata CBS 506.65]OJJ48475.1 hypothetical protein ASPZODRAFT_130515 [Penicilliopsis zonata CBS 506.65]
MADYFSSPFPTTHDTIGTSTLATPYFMPSSPPRRYSATTLVSPTRTKSAGSDRVSTPREAPLRRNSSRRSSVASNRASDLDARLANYTIDFSNFASTQFGPDDKDDLEPLPDMTSLLEADKLSDVGGPEDFTVNMEKYLFGNSQASTQQEKLEQAEEATGQEREDDAEEAEQQETSTLPPRAIEDEPELGEESEFGPPVDMSTPSHLLRRSSGFVKEVTHLEGIEEDPTDEPESPAPTPSVRRQSVGHTQGNHNEKLYEEMRRQIEDLKKTVQDRDEQIAKNRKRVLEAASAAEQIKHLQSELQRKSTLLDDLNAKRGEESLLREQIQLLQKQNAEKETLLHKSTVEKSEFSALQQQITDLQADLRTHNTQPSRQDSERLETIGFLRAQLSAAQDQVVKNEFHLEDALTKLKEVTAAKEQQLREKNTEIDTLKAQVEDQALDIEKLESDLDQANDEYQTLEGRFASLEDKNRPLEEKNISLEADLTRAQTEMTAQQNALKAVAADFPMGAGGDTYTDILELINNLHQPNHPGTSVTLPVDPVNSEIEKLREEIANLRAQLKEAIAAKESLEEELGRSQDQLTEAESLVKSLEGENSRLTARVDDLNATLNRVQSELSRVKEERSEALATIERLQGEKVQQPSPPPSPPNTTHGAASEKSREAELQESHQAQLQGIQTAHATAVSTLRASHAESARKLRNLLAAAEKREADLRSALQTLRQSQSQHDSQVESLGVEIKRLETIIASKEEAAAALDQRIARSIEKREREWERRIDLLLKERDRMGKALLWTWGEKELPGVTEQESTAGRRHRQGYQYKHAKRYEEA